MPLPSTPFLCLSLSASVSLTTSLSLSLYPFLSPSGLQVPVLDGSAGGARFGREQRCLRYRPGVRVEGGGFEASGLEFRVYGFGFSFGFRVYGFRIWGFGFSGSAFKVYLVRGSPEGGTEGSVGAVVPRVERGLDRQPVH